MRPPTLFIYHGNCFDGFTAAWVFEYFRKKNQSLIDHKVEYYPAKYGEDPPDCKGKDVWVVDFSYPRDVMLEKVIIPSAKTTLIDHHKTAQEDLKDILSDLRMKYNLQRSADKVIFDMSRSGSGILFDHLAALAGRQAGVHRPSISGRELWLVDYVEDRDLWKFNLPDSKLVSAYLASVPMTFSEWDAANAMGKNRVTEGGRAIQRYIDNYGAKVREQAHYIVIGEHRVPAINLPYMNISDHVGRLAEEHPEAPFAVGYFRKADGSWQFSLRTRGGEFDVSEVAKLFGGGGHKGAAGFELKDLQKIETPIYLEDTAVSEPSIGLVNKNIRIPPTLASITGDPADEAFDILHLGENTE